MFRRMRPLMDDGCYSQGHLDNDSYSMSILMRWLATGGDDDGCTVRLLTYKTVLGESPEHLSQII
jgi:hypothetical protein